MDADRGSDPLPIHSRCRMHGGAFGSGAPKGNQNAFQYGLYTVEAILERRLLRLLIKQSCATIEQLKP